MSSTFSPSRSVGCSRMQLIGVGAMSRLRSSSIKKLLEPLRGAVADCLSLSTASSSHHGSTFSAVVNEALRTLWVGFGICAYCSPLGNVSDWKDFSQSFQYYSLERKRDEW